MKRFFLIFLLFSAHGCRRVGNTTGQCPGHDGGAGKSPVSSATVRKIKREEMRTTRALRANLKAIFSTSLRNFRDGRRYYRPMALLLEGLPDQYLREMAAYFASLKQAFPPPEPMRASSAEIELARKLVTRGDPTRKYSRVH